MEESSQNSNPYLSQEKFCYFSFGHSRPQIKTCLKRLLSIIFRKTRASGFVSSALISDLSEEPPRQEKTLKNLRGAYKSFRGPNIFSGVDIYLSGIQIYFQGWVNIFQGEHIYFQGWIYNQLPIVHNGLALQAVRPHKDTGDQGLTSVITIMIMVMMVMMTMTVRMMIL